MMIDLEPEDLAYLFRIVGIAHSEFMSTGTTFAGASLSLQRHLLEKLGDAMRREHYAPRPKTVDTNGLWNDLKTLSRDLPTVHAVVYQVEGGGISRNEAALILAVTLANENNSLRRELLNYVTANIPKNLDVSSL